MAKHMGIGHVYKRWLECGYRCWTRYYVKCLYNLGPRHIRFFWEYGCAFFEDRDMHVRHSNRHLMTDCYCAFDQESEIWTQESYKTM